MLIRDVTIDAARGGAACAVALLLLAGCHRAAETPQVVAERARQAAATHDAGVDPAVAEANRRMAGGVPMGNGTAPVEVRFDLGSVPASAQPFGLDVAVIPGAPVPLMKIEVTGSEGLEILEPDAPVVVEKLQAGSLTRVPVRATAASAGTGVVHVAVTLELPAGPESRAFAFPVLVRPGAPVAAGAAPPAAPPPAAKAPAKPAAKPAQKAAAH